MAIIGHPLGDFDERIIISEIYKPKNFREGWFFLPKNFPYYQFVSVDVNPNIEEVVMSGDTAFVHSNYFNLVGNINPSPSGTPFLHTHYERGEIICASGTAPFQNMFGTYWQLFADLNNPFLFIPYFAPHIYGKIVYLKIGIDLPRIKRTLTLIEKILNGIVLLFKEKIIEDRDTRFTFKERIISLLSCDIHLIRKNLIKIVWDGDAVETIEVLRRGLGEKEYGEPIAVLPFSFREYITPIDDNSYTFTVRGINGSGNSLNEISIGLSGLTTMQANVDLGDFIKIYECDMALIDRYEIEMFV